ncbi:MAG: shikimate dehydrogenase [Candidatus Berkelbacteria bacterium]|nr:MAG: shikimate dehydrogenase [Candidatus Berkelbacteria bacterium]QQG51603.1 MAG: shikimate dehydrogenase [Candidatus Berkelbacteria bacterium]
MKKFGFIVHAVTAKDAARRYPFLQRWPDPLIELFMLMKGPSVVGRTSVITSPTGAVTQGVFVGVPMSTRMLQKLPLEFSYKRILKAIEIAAQEGAEVVGLGAHTACIGDGGITLNARSRVPVTSGNSYTVATAIEAGMDAVGRLYPNLDLRFEGVLAVVGATGAIGKTCAQMLKDRFAVTYLIGRDLDRTQAAAESIGLPLSTATTDVGIIRKAHLVISVTSSDTDVIKSEHLSPGTVVVDVARPRDVSFRVQKERQDVLVIEGGVVRVPGKPSFGLNFGFPPYDAYACMSETMVLALEGRCEAFTCGKDVSPEQVEEISRLATRQGFGLSGYRSFERRVEDEDVERIASLAAKRVGLLSDLIAY